MKNVHILPSDKDFEVWKDVVGYEGLYQVSNLGNVRSLNYGKIRELKPRLVGYDGNQYLAVNLSKESKVKSVKVHKLVALCFLNHTSKGYDGLVIDHIDSNKLNNRLDNLKLVTPRFNASKDKQGSSSKFTGVTWHKKSKKWQCQIYDNGKLNHLGLFNTEIEASKTYNNYLENMTKEKPKQRLEKYSERFDNNKSSIGNPETWGKRELEKTLGEVCCNCGKSWYNTTNSLNVFCFLCGKSKEEPKPIHQQIIDIVGGEDKFKEIAKIESKQKLEKYSERFENNSSEIGNPETWGKRKIKDLKQETLEEALNKFKEEHPVLNLYPSHVLQNIVTFGAKWQAERICSSEVLQKIRVSKSDAEARRIIRTI